MFLWLYLEIFYDILQFICDKININYIKHFINRTLFDIFQDFTLTYIIAGFIKKFLPLLYYDLSIHNLAKR